MAGKAAFNIQGTTEMARLPFQEVLRQEEAPNMVKIKSIVLDRAEGRPKECVTRIAFSLAQANEVLRSWSDSAPQEGQGYHKCDIAITWEDGEGINIRYDLKHWSEEAADLPGTLFRAVSILSGKNKPPKWTEQEYRSVIARDPENQKGMLRLYEGGHEGCRKN